MPRNETGMEARSTAIKNQFALEITLSGKEEESRPKEPAAGKPQLPSTRKEKLQEELSAQAARAGAETAVGEDTHQARAPGEPGLRRPWGRLRLPQAPGLGVRPRRVGGETRAEEKRDNAGPGRRLRAFQGSPRRLFPPGASRGRAKFAPQPSLHDPGRRSRGCRPPSAWPQPPSSPRGGSRESARRRRARGEPRARRGAGRARGRGRARGGARGAGGARASGARERSPARGGAGRAALPEDPRPLRRVFG